MLFEDTGPIRTRKISQTIRTKVPGIKVKQKLGQEGRDLEHGFKTVAY